MVLRSIKHWVRIGTRLDPGRARTALPRSAAVPALHAAALRAQRAPLLRLLHAAAVSLDRQFCSKCGNASLVRLQMVINAEVRTRHQRAGAGHATSAHPAGGAPARVRSTNVRGTKFAMPAPQSGATPRI